LREFSTVDKEDTVTHLGRKIEANCLMCGDRPQVTGCLHLCLECFAAFEEVEMNTFTCTVPDPPDPEPMEHHGTYAECVTYAERYAGEDWPFAVIRHASGQLVHLGEGWAYDPTDEDCWNGTY
jgi:hypothetical protein